MLVTVVGRQWRIIHVSERKGCAFGSQPKGLGFDSRAGSETFGQFPLTCAPVHPAANGYRIFGKDLCPASRVCVCVCVCLKVPALSPNRTL